MKKVLILVGIVVVLIAAVFGGIYSHLNQYVHQYEDDQIVEGVFIGDESIAGMTESEIYEVIDQLIEVYNGVSITLTTTEPEVTQNIVTMEELGLEITNSEAIIAEAMTYGKEGSLLERYQNMKDLEKNNVVYEVEYTIDSDLINAYVDEHYTSMTVEAVDATLEYSNGELLVIGGSNGVRIDTEEAVTKIEAFLSAEWRGESGTIDLSVIEVEPEVTAESLEEATDILGTYSTYCANTGNRYENVKRGAELVNGTVLEPGESFSVAETVSPFTEENGYYNAGSYLDGEVVDSMGGGICQVSSTVYNAVLYAELEVNSRSAHSLSVSYVDAARDAAIAGDYKDLKFTNSTDSPIYIYAELVDTTLTVTIFGDETRAENRTIEIKSVLISENGYADPVYEENSSLELGTVSKVSSGYQGKTAELWKYIYVDGVLDEEVRINSTTYQATSETYEVGTKSSNSEASALVSTAIATQEEEKITAAISSANTLIEEEEAAEKAAEEAAAQAKADEEAAEKAAEEAANAEASTTEGTETTE